MNWNLGPNASEPALGIDGVIEQIRLTRQHQTGGFVIFNYGVAEAERLLPALGLGISAAKPAGPAGLSAPRQ